MENGKWKISGQQSAISGQPTTSQPPQKTQKTQTPQKTQKTQKTQPSTTVSSQRSVNFFLRSLTSLGPLKPLLPLLPLLPLTLPNVCKPHNQKTKSVRQMQGTQENHLRSLLNVNEEVVYRSVTPQLPYNLRFFLIAEEGICNLHPHRPRAG